MKMKMKMKMFLCAVMLMFVVSGCAGYHKGGSDSMNSKKCSKEDHKKMEMDKKMGMDKTKEHHKKMGMEKNKEGY